jgi:serine/threonine-protein kinase
MAEIVLARQHSAAGISRLVVVKRVLSHRASDPQFVQMFLDEARLVASISHPNVVQIHDVGQQGQNYYLVMELIRGLTVDGLITASRERGRKVPLDVAAELVTQACDGLHAAHELRDEGGRRLGLVHRDLSPHNLMVSEEGVIKLVDFGVAKARTTAATETGTVKGKCAYMSPEQCLGEPLDHRSDLFSLGATFYELVTGAPLFEQETDYMTQRAVVEGPVSPPSALRPDLPPELEMLILQSLERAPALRCASAAEMGETLRAIRGRLELGGDPARMAEYLQEECAALLAEQARSIRQLSEQTAVDAGAVDAAPMHPEPGPIVQEPTAPSGPAHGSLAAAPSTSVKAAGQASVKSTTGRRVLRRWLPLLLLLVFAVAVGVGWVVRRLTAPEPPLRLGLSPAFKHEAIRQELEPFLGYLERALGRKIVIVVDRGYDDLRMDLVRGDLDLAALSHVQVLYARRGPVAPRVLAVMSYHGATTYRSVLVVRDNSGVRRLADLAGRRFCWVNRGSASGYLMPRHLLRRRGFDPERFFGAVRYSGSHLAALRDVIEGRCEATATSAGWMQIAPKRGVAASRLRVLAEAGRIPLDHICAKRQLPLTLAKQLQQALLDFVPKRDIGRDVIGEHFLADGFTRPRRGDFDALRRALRQEHILP